MIVVFYSELCCFDNSSTLIAVTIERLFGDLFKPLLAELGTRDEPILLLFSPISCNILLKVYLYS